MGNSKHMKKNKKKRYWFSVVEEMIQNPKFFRFRGGRIEVYDQKDKNAHYAIYEARFMIPEEFIVGFRELFDGVESDEMPYIVWDIKEFERKKSETKQGCPHTIVIDSMGKIPKITIADGTQGMRRGE